MKRFLMGFILVWALVPSSALAWDAFPTLVPGAHYAGSGRWTSSQDVEECLSTLSASSDANYFASIVNNTSPSGSTSDNDAVPYVDALSEAWSKQIRPDIDVVIVLGVDNRAVAVHPGSTWARVGFETNKIKATIDNSSFKSFARAQDYAGGVCALAEAVQAEITSLQKNQERVLKTAQAQVGTYRTRISALRSRVQKEVADAEATKLAEEKLVNASDSIDELVFSIGQKNVPEISSKSQHVLNDLTSVEGLLRRQAEMARFIEEFEPRVVALQGEMLKSGLSEGAKKRLNDASMECLNARPGAVDLFFESPFVMTANDCLRDVEDLYRRAEKERYIRTVLMPSMVLFSFLLGVFIAFVVFYRRRNSAKYMAKTQLEIWSDKLATASERLLDLEGKFAGYLSGTTTRYEGATAELDVVAADAVNLVFLMYDQSVEIRKRAVEVFEAAPLYRARNFEECVSTLTTTPVAFETGMPETQLRVFLPLTQSYQGTAASVLNELDFRYEAAIKALTALQREVEQAMEWDVQVQDHFQAAQVAVNARRTFGFPVDLYQNELEVLAAEMEAFAGKVRYDPVAANAGGAILLDLVSGVESRVALGNECLRVLVDDVTPMAQSVRAKVGTLRAAGWALREPGFDPDAALDYASLMARELRELVAAYQDVKAPALRDRIQLEVQTTNDRLSVTVKARDAVPRRLAELAQGKIELEARIPKARTTLERLAHENAASAFQIQADNLDELEVVLGDIQSWIHKIELQFSSEHYLAATADSERCQIDLEAGTALLDEIYQAEAHLRELKKQTTLWRVECDELLSRCFARKDRPGVGEVRRDRLNVLKGRAATAYAHADGALPDWPLAFTEIRELLALLQTLDKESELGRSAAALARDEYLALGAAIEALSKRVEAEDRDRPHVARFIAQIRTEFAAFSATLEDSRQLGEHLEDGVAELQEQLAQAERLWDTERKLIDEAALEQRLAADELKRVRSKHYGHGFKPSLGHATALLSEIEIAAQKREWEEVFSKAQAVIQNVRSEEKSCMRLAAEHAATIAAIHTPSYQSTSRGHSSLSSSSSSTSWPSSSSFGSSSSSSSSSSWSSSSSGGSSFGSSGSSSSSSGGSSW